MAAEALLAQFEGVRQTGRRRWMARCPGHDDCDPSLSVRELDDGRILLHCFGQCGVEEVLGAIGLEFDALFPERPIEHAPRERRPFFPSDVLACLSEEALLVAVAAANLAQRVELSDADLERLMVAVSRIEAARGLANGER